MGEAIPSIQEHSLVSARPGLKRYLVAGAGLGLSAALLSGCTTIDKGSDEALGHDGAVVVTDGPSAQASQDQAKPVGQPDNSYTSQLSNTTNGEKAKQQNFNGTFGDYPGALSVESPQIGTFDYPPRMNFCALVTSGERFDRVQDIFSAENNVDTTAFAQSANCGGGYVHVGERSRPEITAVVTPTDYMDSIFTANPYVATSISNMSLQSLEQVEAFSPAEDGASINVSSSVVPATGEKQQDITMYLPCKISAEQQADLGLTSPETAIISLVAHSNITQEKAVVAALGQFTQVVCSAVQTS